jgi:hypothetical protein
MSGSVALDPRVLSVLTEALDHDSVTVQMVLLQCFSLAFGGCDWWLRMLADDPAVAALVKSASHRTVH